MRSIWSITISIILLSFFSNCKKTVEADDFSAPVSLNTINAGGDDFGVKIFNAPDEGYYLLGNSYTNNNKYEVFFTKVNSNGVAEKTDLYGGSNSDLILDAAMDAQGNILAVGKTSSKELLLGNGFYVSQYYLLYFDKNGALKWQTGYTDTTAQFALQNVEDYATQKLPLPSAMVCVA